MTVAKNDKERLLKQMKIPAKAKLIWLYQMKQFIDLSSSAKKIYAVRKKLRSVE